MLIVFPRVLTFACGLLVLGWGAYVAAATDPVAGDPMLLTDGATAPADASTSVPLAYATTIATERAHTPRYDADSAAASEDQNPMLLTDGLSRPDSRFELASATARASNDALEPATGLVGSEGEAEPDDPAAPEHEVRNAHWGQGGSGLDASMCGGSQSPNVVVKIEEL